MTALTYGLALLLIFVAPGLWAGATILACDRASARLAGVRRLSAPVCLGAGMVWWFSAGPGTLLTCGLTLIAHELLLPGPAPAAYAAFAAGSAMYWLVSTICLLPALIRLNAGLRRRRFVATVIVGGAVAALGPIASLPAAVAVLDSVDFLYMP
ncbi:hypothetical protein [Alienimonas chondri]|uniref:Uncharacterized protein n=1 Tax=Alienimonas chondri TaxID=2681879 RepID=A0ABX1V9G5_9PLAN|nr:hypothetical protein [Alienimonas chondri]NNJ24394.1 hypothetical protein [Alienimonas chondri]